MDSKVSVESTIIDHLWERYCGCLHSYSNKAPGNDISTLLNYTDTVVDEIWKLFLPILNKVKLLPLGSASSSAAYPISAKLSGYDLALQGNEIAIKQAKLTDEDPHSDYGSFSVTHFFYIALKGPKAEDRQAWGYDFVPSDMVNSSAGPPAPVLSSEMVSALCLQPHIILPLLEFFVALMEYRRRTRVISTPRCDQGLLNNEKVDLNLASEMMDIQKMCVSCCVLGDETNPVTFDQLGAAQLGRLLTLKGTVVRMSPPRITCTRMTYRCGLCGSIRKVTTQDGLLIYPGSCGGKKRCRGYKWLPMSTHAVCEEVQFLKVQEYTDFFDLQAQSSSDSATKEPSGGAYRVVEVQLRHPFLDSVTVGDTVWVCGILHTYWGELRRRISSLGGTQSICIRARSINVAKNMWWKTLNTLPKHGPSSSAKCAAGTGSWWSPDECAGYYEMARHPRWFMRLTASVAPSLYGLHREKEAILLAIVGGSQSSKVGCRSGIHVLLLGDPGTGKSQLLRAACAIAPRSAFVCAHTSSSCGLTMTLVRDPMTGGASFEAGAVVHGDGGVTCIDEIDKSSTEHKSLLEVMEQETVSIAKAGMVFSMPVHTSILAAGNCVGGRFDFSKPITANVNLSQALLSRFDLVVCMHARQEPGNLHPDHSSGTNAAISIEQADSWDNALTNHVLDLHRPHVRIRRVGSEKNFCQSEGCSPSSGAHTAGSGVLPHSLVREFIIFCRSQCQPTLSSAALQALKVHYLQERAAKSANQSSPAAAPTPGRHYQSLVTPRYLQGLVRIAEARAKVELRDEVTREDAEYAIGLVQNCLCSFTSNPSTKLTSSSLTSMNGWDAKGRKKNNQREVVVAALKEAIVRAGNVNELSYNTILHVCEDAGCRDGNAMLHQLNEFGILLKNGTKYSLNNM